jgi:flagellar hook-associated protein 2
MTGMMSGLDTESIIQELVAAKRTKVDKQKKAQTRLDWKQEKWKDLNDKLKKLQTKYINNMRYRDAYSKKVTKVSNSSAVSVITGADAVNGVQSLEIEKLAKTGYLTGAAIKGKDGKELTALSKLSDIDGMGLAAGATGTINIKTGNKSVDIEITGDTTISDVLTQIKSVGLNASFDAKWQRFNISSPESGKDNDFSITALDGNGANALSALGIQTDLTKDPAALNEYEEYAGYYVSGDRAATLANMQGFINADITSRTNAYLDQYKSLVDARKAANDAIDGIKDKYKGTTLGSADSYKTALDAKNEEIKKQEEDIAKITDPDAKRAAEEKLADLKKEASELEEKHADATALAAHEENVKKYDDQIADIETYINVTDNGDGTYSAAATSKLQGEVEDRYYAKAEYAAQAKANGYADLKGNASKVAGEDAVIVLNGARYENSNNTFEINGLTFTALNETKGETITVTTEQDTDGIYDMVKDFLKAYNEIVNEMDKLYNADSAKGYEPLTDEEKEAMSEKEVEKWEEKIKDSILRRDDNLSTVNSALQMIMSAGVEVNGKKMYLSDFGIDTLGYFNAADNEKHAYHIDGDPDDDSTSNKEDKLKSMIANDPDTVISFFSGLSKNLYDKMFEMSKSVDGYRSFGNFYDDKKMKSDYDSYKSKIAELEVKLTEYENKWYAKFSKMETALAKMQSNASAVTSLLGG